MPDVMQFDLRRLREMELQLSIPAEPPQKGSRKSKHKPAPLDLSQTPVLEHSRIGPVPKTPLKRKVSPVEPHAPVESKKRLIEALRTTGASSPKTVKDNLAITMNDDGAKEKAADTFPFMKLPGELRNIIYAHCVRMSSKQALVVHLPRTQTLRSSTRQARVARGRFTEPEDPDKKKRGPSKSTAPKESNRPFVGLTQVSRQIRYEFYPLYIARQEIGMDLVHSATYIRTYFNPKMPFSFSGPTDPKGKNMCFSGNLTIALPDRIFPIEKKAGYIDILPLLHTWANSHHIEAGFGRYSRKGYDPHDDGEAKDLYRLYGRKVLQDRSCSHMNPHWRVVLRNRVLAAVRIIREHTQIPGETDVSKPHFHLIWKYEYRHSWMTQVHSLIPGTDVRGVRPGSFLWELGFDRMEHFGVRVGAETYPGQFSLSI